MVIIIKIIENLKLSDYSIDDQLKLNELVFLLKNYKNNEKNLEFSKRLIKGLVYFIGIDCIKTNSINIEKKKYNHEGFLEYLYKIGKKESTAKDYCKRITFLINMYNHEHENKIDEINEQNYSIVKNWVESNSYRTTSNQAYWYALLNYEKYIKDFGNKI